MATKKMDVPDINNLLSTITKKRDSGELPATEIQRVGPVVSEVPESHEADLPASSKAGKTVKRQNVKPSKDGAPSTGGRPTTKDKENIEYVKITPRIPKALKKAVEFARIEERFRDQEGRPVTTIDGVVTLALERLLK